MDPFAPRNYGMLRVRPRTSGFSTDEDEMIELEFSSDSGVEKDRAEMSSRLATHSGAATTTASPHVMLEKRKKHRKGTADVVLKLQNRNFKVKARDSEIFDDEDHGDLNEQEYKELYKVEYNSAFTKIVTNTEYRSIIEPYLNITSEEQSARLGNDEPHQQEPTDSTAPASRFARIDRQVRVALRRQTGTGFIKELEETLIHFIHNGAEADYPNSPLPLVLLFRDGYHRLMAHGVCQYYDLKSVSVAYSGERVTVISKQKPNQTVQLPSLSLHEYLKYLKEQESHMYDAIEDSTTNTAPFSRIPTRTFVHEYKAKKEESTKQKAIKSKPTKQKRRKH
jgi:hypothetical protein